MTERDIQIVKIWELTDWRCSKNIYDHSIVSIYRCGDKYTGLNINDVYPIIKSLPNNVHIWTKP